MRHALTLAALLAATAPMAMAQEAAAPAAPMTEDQRAAFDAAVRDYLLRNPEVIVEAMTELQMREDRAAAERDVQMLADNSARIFDNPSDWSGGNLQGDVVVVEFMDYRCGYCHKAYQEVEDLVSTDGNIRFVLKEFPVLGEKSVLASKFAISVRMLYGDEAYKAAHDALFAFRGEIDADSLSRLAAELGHDPAAITARMDTPEVQAVIDANYELAEIMEINGTPTFVIDGTMVRGYVPLDGMQQIVADERAKG